MVGWIPLIFFFVVVVSACCLSGSDNSGSASTKGNSRSGKTNAYNRRNDYYDQSSYSECPSCGDSYFDGYCEECGYPDVNQGWVGENY